jgi:MFS family permease
MQLGKFSSIYFGWWINIFTAVSFGFVSSYVNQGASIIFKYVSADLALTRAETSIASGIGSLQSGIVFPLAGWLSDRYGSKWLAFTGCCITGTGLFLMNYVQSAQAYYVVWGLMVVGGNTLGFSVAIDRLITNWFVRKRGLAFSVRFAVLGVATVTLLPFISFLVSSLGWRVTSLIWSVVAFACIPVTFIFVRQHGPEYYGLKPDDDTVYAPKESDKATLVADDVTQTNEADEQDFTLSQALKTPTYWMLTVVWTLYMGIQSSVNVHIIPMLTDTGISLVEAGGLVAMMTFFSLPSRFLSGIIADRVSKDKVKYLLAGNLTLYAIGLWVLQLSPEFTWRLYLFLVFFGLGSGAFVPLDIITRSRYYGRKAYGGVQGVSMIFSAPVTFLSPIFTGWVYDSSLSYMNAFQLFAVLATCSAAIICFVKAPKLMTE